MSQSENWRGTWSKQFLHEVDVHAIQKSLNRQTTCACGMTLNLENMRDHLESGPLHRDLGRKEKAQ